MTAKVISVINMKGGVAKTTLTKEISFHLAAVQNKRVLVIDADPQANLTQSFFRLYHFRQPETLASNKDINSKFEEKRASINVIYSNTTGVNPEKDDVIVEFPDIPLSIIPGDLSTIFMEVNTDSGRMGTSLTNYLRFSNDPNILEQYDYIFIDCPPTYSTYTIAAIYASDFYLIPVKPDDYSVLGIRMLTKVIKDIQKQKVVFQNRIVKNLGIIFTDISDNTSVGLKNTIKQIKESKELNHEYFFQTFFRKNPQFFKDLGYFIDLSKSEKSKENLTALTAELLTRLEP